MIHSNSIRRSLQLGLLIGLSALSFSCNQLTAPGLEGEAIARPKIPDARVRPDKVVQTAGQDLELNPKVDILFVIDNSLSMQEEQYRLARNIRAFVEAIEKNPLIDYHIGVVPVYDKEQFEEIQKNQLADKYSYLQDADLFYDRKGFLQPLLDPSSFPREESLIKGTINWPYQKTMLNPELPPFVTKDIPNYQDVLAATLFIGVIPWKIDDPSVPGKIVRIGPQEEEVFSPILEVINPSEATMQNNSGFRRPDAHFVSIIITDSDDADGIKSSKISASDLNFNLQKYTAKASQNIATSGPKQNYSVYGVIFPPTKEGQTDADVCPGEDELKVPFSRDNSQLQPHKIVSLLKLARGLPEDSAATPWLSLCDPNFGEQLAAIGDEIRLKASDVEIALDYFPERNKDGSHSIKVFYGEREIMPGSEGWMYSGAKRNSVVIKANFETACTKPITTPEGEVSCETTSVTDLGVSNKAAQQDVFRVEYTPVDILAAEEGHTKKMFIK